MSTDGRPLEYGDQKPSDQDDTPPGDPTAGFQERDYSIDQSGGKKRSVQTERDFIPDLGVGNPEPVERDSWDGVIVRALNKRDQYPRRYEVLRNDGELIHAMCWQLLNYEEFKPGHDVVVNRGPTPADFVIVGKARPKELQAITVFNSQSREANFPFIVPFDIFQLAVPISDHFSDKPTPALAPFNGRKIHGIGIPGIFKVEEEDEAVYDITFSVSLTHTNPIETQAEPSFYQTGCWEHEDLIDATRFGAWVRSPKVYFHEQNGFRVYYDPCDCTANIALRSGKPDMILNQQFPKDQSGREDLNKVAEWTDEPRIGNNIQVGTRVHQGWVKIGSEDQYVWLSHGGGGGRLKLKFPQGPPCGSDPNSPSVKKPFGGFLQAVAVSGECVRLGWRKPGKSGSIKVQSCDVASWNYCYIYCCDEEGYPKEDGPYQTCAIPVHQCYTIDFNCGLIGDVTADDENMTKHSKDCFENLPRHVCCWKTPDFFDPCEFHETDPFGGPVKCEPLRGCVTPQQTQQQ